MAPSAVYMAAISSLNRGGCRRASYRPALTACKNSPTRDKGRITDRSMKIQMPPTTSVRLASATQAMVVTVARAGCMSSRLAMQLTKRQPVCGASNTLAT